MHHEPGHVEQCQRTGDPQKGVDRELVRGIQRDSSAPSVEVEDRAEVAALDGEARRVPGASDDDIAGNRGRDDGVHVQRDPPASRPA